MKNTLHKEKFCVRVVGHAICELCDRISFGNKQVGEIIVAC